MSDELLDVVHATGLARPAKREYRSGFDQLIESPVTSELVFTAFCYVTSSNNKLKVIKMMG